MNDSGTGLNCVMAMYDLCLLKQNAGLPERTWSQEGYDSYLKLRFDKVQQGLWGVYNIYDALATTGGYYPLNAALFQGRRSIGTVSMGRLSRTIQPTLFNGSDVSLGGDERPPSSRKPSDFMTDISIGRIEDYIKNTESALPWTTFTLPDSDSETPCDLTGTPTLGNDPPLSIQLRYNGATFPKTHFFWNLISSMGFFAPECKNRETIGVGGKAGEPDLGGLDLMSEFEDEAETRPLLKIRHVLKVVKIMAKWMVKYERYEEMDISVMKGATVIALGRFRAPRFLDGDEVA